MRIGFFGDSLTEGLPGVPYVDILQERFPSDELVNFGRAGDSVIGTLQRVRSLRNEKPFDLAFVWTGVNDVLARISWVSPTTRRLTGKPWADSRDEFIAQYRTLLEVLSPHAARIVAVAPLFIGEDLSNPWNQELDVRAREMESLCGDFDGVEFLSLRPYMTDVASGECASPFVEKRGLATVWEAIAFRDPEDVDRVASERGLCYTMDGIHLNSRGAKAVADALAERIRSVKEHGTVRCPMPSPTVDSQTTSPA
jgi:lysophospholipase L1-like esterase